MKPGRITENTRLICGWPLPCCLHQSGNTSVNWTSEGNQNQPAHKSWHIFWKLFLSKHQFQPIKFNQWRDILSWRAVKTIRHRVQPQLLTDEEQPWSHFMSVAELLCCDSWLVLVNIPMLAGRWEQISIRIVCRLAKMCSLGMSSCGEERKYDDIQFFLDFCWNVCFFFNYSHNAPSNATLSSSVLRRTMAIWVLT